MTTLLLVLVLPAAFIAGMICFRWFRLTVMILLLVLGILFYQVSTKVHPHYRPVTFTEMPKNSYLQSTR